MTTRQPDAELATSADVRARLVQALRLDLVGPGGGLGVLDEQISRRDRPSNWYLTGFLIPAATAPEKAADPDEGDDDEEEEDDQPGVHPQDGVVAKAGWKQRNNAVSHASARNCFSPFAWPSLCRPRRRPDSRQEALH